jgi:protein-disulfide isomerase/uncharacterized membrane protein
MSKRFNVVILATIGLFSAIWSLINHVKVNYSLETQESFCDISATVSCSIIERSSWSKFLGIPIASYGILFFTTIILLTLLYRKESFWKISFALAILSSLISVVLFLIAKFIVESICLLCIISYFSNFGLLLITYCHIKKDGIVNSISTGANSLLRLPLELISENSNSNFLLIILIIISSFISLWGLPLFIKSKLSQPTILRDEIKRQSIFSEWSQRPIEKIDINYEGSGKDYFLGSKNAQIIIVEFFDFECPACQRSFFELSKLVEKYPSKIQLVLKNYPLDSDCNNSVEYGMHEYACFSAVLARCAGEQEQFWPVAKALFSDKHFNVTSRLQFKNSVLSAVLGVDKTKLDKCLNNNHQSNYVSKDIKQGDSIKLQFTPTVLINGRKTDKINKNEFEYIISELIKLN